MRRMTLPLMLFVVACQPATIELTDAEKAAIADTVNALQAESWDAWRSADLDRALSYMHDSPDFWFALQGQALRGYDESDSFWRDGFGTASRLDITISDSRTMVLAADIVAVFEQGAFSVTDAEGMTSPEQPFVMSATWVRRHGEWGVLYGHESWPVPESM